ncbi:hypothetical protein [Sinomonas sp. P47F7]|uniref:hypothetical protein n=1 Tax=Sinomonas sp. P47F7 TaxID=3410987 RepID=UPI003BF55642
MRFTASTPATRVALAAALGLGLLTATGCGYINPQQTSIQYSASDGIRADVGSVQLRNVLIASTGKSGSSQSASANAPGRMIGTLFNTSGQDLTVSLSTPSSNTVSVTIPKNGEVRLETTSTPVDFSHVGGVPGSLVDVKVNAGGTSQSVKVPVLDGTIADYRTYLPTPSPSATSSASSSTSASSSASGSASATPSATPSK